MAAPRLVCPSIDPAPCNNILEYTKQETPADRLLKLTCTVCAKKWKVDAATQTAATGFVKADLVADV